MNRRTRRVVRSVVLLGVVAAETAILAPRLSEDGIALHGIHWPWLVAAVLAEVGSVLSVGALYRPLLGAGRLPMTRRRSAAIGAAASAINATAPAGTAVASGYLYRQFRRAGSDPVLAGWAVAVATTLSALAFFAVASSGASLRAAGSPLVSVAHSGLVLVIALVVVIAVSAAVSRHARPLSRAASAVYRRIPGTRSRSFSAAARERTTAHFAAIRPTLRQWTSAFGFATLTWAFDMACFVLSLRAVGVDQLPVGAATLAYSAGLATGSITIVPAGIGTLEAGMLLGLTRSGVHNATALAGIVTYRLVAYVLMAAVGWVVWTVLRRRSTQLRPSTPVGA